MSQLDIQEYASSGPISLTVDERDALKTAIRDLTITPVHGELERYSVTPTSTVGALEVGDLSVRIEPKIGIPQLLSLACYAIGRVRFRKDDFDFPEDAALPDALALALSAAARQAFARGLLHGYLSREDALTTVRGRVRFDEQIRRRHGFPLPLEVRYDEFTADILPNRLVAAAVRQLGRLRLRSTAARHRLSRVRTQLDGVSFHGYQRNAVPRVAFDRLNEHYREVVALARLVLRHGAYEAERGEIRASGFLMDMNRVFQEFLTAALRERLELPASAFGERSIESLDESGRVTLRPDLVWTEDGGTVFVGDAKYKHASPGTPKSDIYQLLAYSTAVDLPGGLLVYAKGEAEELGYTVRHTGKHLRVVALDLSGSLDEVLHRVERIAEAVRALRHGAAARRVA